MRIPDAVLEHRITVRRRQAVGSSTGPRYDDEVAGVHALVVDKAELVLDARTDSDTRGSQILASSQALVQPEDYVPPGSLVRVWPGTPMERTLEVVATAYLEHSKAPSQAQMWLV